MRWAHVTCFACRALRVNVWIFSGWRCVGSGKTAVRANRSYESSIESQHLGASRIKHLENIDRVFVRSGEINGRSRNVAQWKWSHQQLKNQLSRGRWHWIKICLIQFVNLCIFPPPCRLLVFLGLAQVATLVKLWEMKSDFIKHSKRPFNSLSSEPSIADWCRLFVGCFCADSRRFVMQTISWIFAFAKQFSLESSTGSRGGQWIAWSVVNDCYECAITRFFLKIKREKSCRGFI